MNDKEIESIVKACQIATLESVVQEIKHLFNTYKQDLSIGMIINFFETMIEVQKNDK